MYQKPFYRFFRALVTGCVNWRKTVILITLILFASSIYSFRFVENQFFPSSKRHELIVDLWLPQGSSFQATEAQAKVLEQLLSEDENIINYDFTMLDDEPVIYMETKSNEKLQWKSSVSGPGRHQHR